MKIVHDNINLKREYNNVDFIIKKGTHEEVKGGKSCKNILMAEHNQMQLRMFVKLFISFSCSKLQLFPLSASAVLCSFVF